MKFCKDCKYIMPPITVESICLHDRAVMQGSAYFVTGEDSAKTRYRCNAMRAGICQDAQLFEPSAIDTSGAA